MRIWIAFLLGTVGPVALFGQTLDQMSAFNGGDGARPSGRLVWGAFDHWFGTTQYGGGYGGGTVLKMSPSGAFKILHEFCSQSQDQLCADGKGPLGGLAKADDGDLYGTTYEGGGGSPAGGGTVFKISTIGMLTTLHEFCLQPDCPDGAGPTGTMMQASNGAFYGTTSYGGGKSNGGTIFRINPEGKLTTLYRFCAKPGCADGSGPQGALIEASNGALYGTTASGGVYGGGTVFTIPLGGGDLTTLYSFCYSGGCAGGGSLFSGLIQSPDGNFYGATTYNTPGGTIFELTPSGTLTTIYSFCAEANCPDGMYPQQLTMGSDGNIYGTTLKGGANGAGTAFRISFGGALTTLYQFCLESGCADGSGPEGGLAENGNGNFYGMTSYGGRAANCKDGCGTIYQLIVP